MTDKNSDAIVQHSSRIELSQSAMRQNIKFVRNLIGSHPQISVVVKANAYGHGFAEAVTMAERCGIRHFAVASSHEAQQIIDVIGPESRIMIMGIMYETDLPWIIASEIEVYVFSFTRLKRIAEVAAQVDSRARIHLELETGGHRTGLDLDKLPEALKFITAKRKHLELVGVCTHLAGAESIANNFRVSRQLDEFNRVRRRLRKYKTLAPLFHIASSAATLTIPESRIDLVRIGTLTYGLWPSPDVHNLFLMQSSQRTNRSLKRVLSWKSDVMQVKKIRRNEFVGYGTSFQAPRDCEIAVIPVGYGNGYPRELSNRGHVLIRGRRAPVVGAINMNMFFADVTNIPGVVVGDETVLVGRQGKNEITLRSFSEFSSALNTEFVSRLPGTIPRKIVK